MDVQERSFLPWNQTLRVVRMISKMKWLWSGLPLNCLHLKVLFFWTLIIVCSEKLNGVASKLPFAHCTQSRLICSATGDEMNEENEPLMLPNGMIYGRLAINLLTENDEIICPRTKEKFHAKDVKRVYVMWLVFTFTIQSELQFWSSSLIYLEIKNGLCRAEKFSASWRARRGPKRWK